MFKSYGIILFLALTLGVQATPGVIATQAAPTTIKAKAAASAFQQYNIHAQCARLAAIAEYPRLSKTHLITAEQIRPKNIPLSDLTYRFGYTDGSVATRYRLLSGKYSYKRIARHGYKVLCPGVV